MSEYGHMKFPYLDQVTTLADGHYLEQNYIALEQFASRTCKPLHIPHKQWMRVDPLDTRGPEYEQANWLAIERWGATLGACCPDTPDAWTWYLTERTDIPNGTFSEDLFYTFDPGVPSYTPASVPWALYDPPPGEIRMQITEDGTYRIDVRAWFDDVVGAGERAICYSVWHYDELTEDNVEDFTVEHLYNDAFDVFQPVTFPAVELTVGQYLEFGFFQSSGDTLQLEAAANFPYTYGRLTRLS